MSEKSKGINAAMKKASVRMKVITGIQNAVADCQTHKAVHDKYLKIGWKARQAAFAESHKDEPDSLPLPRGNCSRTPEMCIRDRYSSIVFLIFKAIQIQND